MPQKKTHEKLLRDVDAVKKQVHAITNKVNTVLTRVKKHYAALDPKTRKKIVTSIAGLGMVLAARHIYKKHRKK